MGGGVRLAGAAVVAGAAVIAVGWARYGPDQSLSLLDGPLPRVVIALAMIGVIVGVAGRDRQWWLSWGLHIATGAALTVAAVWWWIRASGIVDQHYPPSFFFWAWGGLVAVGVAVTGWWSGPFALRMVRVVAAPLALFASFLLINVHYGYWPTMGALLHRPVEGQVSGQGVALALAGQQLGPVGRFGPVSIVGPSGFDAGSAWVWLPPAFNRVPHAHQAVLVMLPGVPGKSNNWEVAGEVVPLADAWARAHDGVAPVMVFVSGNGAADRDTECVNGTQGAAETYLTRSVPHFITHVLGIARGPAHWGVVGFSEGGTCAVGLATGHPGLFGRFIDIAGELYPTYGHNRATTLTGLYAGNATAMLHHEPLWLLAQHRYPHSEGWFAGSGEDHHDERVAVKLAVASATAGMRAFELNGGPGGHSWSFARLTFDRLYPALVDSMPAPGAPVASQRLRHRVLVTLPGSGSARPPVSRAEGIGGPGTPRTCAGYEPSRTGGPTQLRMSCRTPLGARHPRVLVAGPRAPRGHHRST